MSAKVPIRPVVAQLPAYTPGARPAVGFQAYKASSNENPFSPLPAVLAAIADAAADLNRYPTFAGENLRDALAPTLGVEPAGIVTGDGSVAVLGHLLQAFCEDGDEVVYAWRSFEAYPIAVQLTGAMTRPVPLTVTGEHDLLAMSRAVRSATKVVLLCSPNNPTGPALRHQDVVRFLKVVPSHVLVVLDEAYVEFVTDPDGVRGLDLLAEFPNVVLLRTFSKAYGLAGLRVGYAVARPRIAAAIRAAATPFGVSSLAEAAAVASVGQERIIRERVAELAARRDAFAATLRGQGWTIPDPQGNFIWLPLGSRSAAFAEAATEAGVTVRPYDRDGVRISIAEPAALAILASLTASWVDDQQPPTAKK